MGSKVDSGRDERCDHVRVMFRCGPHQRRLALRRLLRVHVGSTSDQHSNGVHAAAARARHERCLAGRDRRVWIGAGVQEELDERGARVGARQRQRCDAKVVGRVGVCASAYQQARRLEIIPVRGPEERRRAVIRSDVDAGVLIQQTTNLLHVPVPGRFDQADIAACGCGRRHHQQRYQERRSRAGWFAVFAHAGFPGLASS